MGDFCIFSVLCVVSFHYFMPCYAFNVKICVKECVYARSFFHFAPLSVSWSWNKYSTMAEDVVKKKNEMKLRNKKYRHQYTQNTVFAICFSFNLFWARRQ